jgi:hypothetical protein
MPIDTPVIQPPAIYRTMPSRYPVSEEVRPFAEVNSRCHEWLERWGNFTMTGRTVSGCQMVVNNVCVIIRVDNDMVREHEVAHCNGWPNDHPGGTWIGVNWRDVWRRGM